MKLHVNSKVNQRSHFWLYVRGLTKPIIFTSCMKKITFASWLENHIFFDVLDRWNSMPTPKLSNAHISHYMVGDLPNESYLLPDRKNNICFLIGKSNFFPDFQFILCYNYLWKIEKNKLGRKWQPFIRKEKQFNISSKIIFFMKF